MHVGIEEVVEAMENMLDLSKGAEDLSERSRVLLEDLEAEAKHVSEMKHASLVKLASTAERNTAEVKALSEQADAFDTAYALLVKHIKKSTDRKTARALLSIHKAVQSIFPLRHIPSMHEKVCNARDAFDALLFTLVDDLPDLLRREGTLSALKIFKVVDREDRASAAQNAPPPALDLLGNASLPPAAPSSAPRGKSREKIFEVFLESIESRFREELGEDSVRCTPASLSFIIEDLRALKKTETSGLPAKYCIFPFAAIHYHRALYEYLDTHCQAFDPSAAVAILLWTREYYGEMEKLGRAKGSLGPLLLAEKEASIIDKYISAVSEKLSGWTSNLTRTECRRFREREKAPDLDAENRFISVGFMDLFHIIRQQIEPVHAHQTVFQKVSEHVLRCTESFQKGILDVLHKEFDSIKKDKAANGFEEYCIAVANSGLKFMDCLHTLPFYGDKPMQDIGGVFYDTFLAAKDVLVQNIFMVLKPALKHLFTSTWTAEPVSDTVVATLGDYMADYHETMLDHAFQVFVGSLVSHLASAYMDRLGKKSSVFKPEHLHTLGTDRRKYGVFFGQYFEKDAIPERFKKFDLFVSISSNPNVALCAAETKMYFQAYPHEPKDRIRNVLKKMPGGSREFATEVLKRCASTYRH